LQNECQQWLVLRQTANPMDADDETDRVKQFAEARINSFATGIYRVPFL
jgi:hypothetical protein